MSSNLEEIKSNLSCSIAIFNNMMDGNIPFEFVSKLKECAGRVSFSGILMIAMKKKLEGVLHLVLLKDEGDGENVSTLNLADIDLNVDNLPQKGFAHMQYARISGDDYCHRIGVRFNYVNVVTKGPGRYAIFLISDESGYIDPINGFYFEIV